MAADADIRAASRVTRRSRTSFGLSFAILPREKREAMHVVYAFCRETDDIVDEEGPADGKLRRLDTWSAELERGLAGDSAVPLLNLLGSVAERFSIPPRHFRDLVAGMRLDLERTRYETFEDLRSYCYHVASTVGLMSSAIFGWTRESTLRYAEDLGIALQLTNILRDVGADAAMGRVYLPGEDLTRFGCTADDILARRDSPALAALLAFELRRARGYYDRARAALAPEDHAAFLPARIMDRTYAKILDAVGRSGCGVLHARARIPAMAKLAIVVREILRRAPRPPRAEEGGR